MTLTFDRYGLHWIEGNIGLLVQQNRVDHVLGISMQFDVVVKPPRQRMICPHNIPLEDAVWAELPDDDLVRAMLPVPKPFGQKVLFVEEHPNNREYLMALCRLSSSEQVYPVWQARADMIAPQLRVTNVAPLIIAGYNPDQMKNYSSLIQMGFHSSRQLILIGPASAVLRPEVQRVVINPTDLSGIPLERVGAWHLRERMLGYAERSQ